MKRLMLPVLYVQNQYEKKICATYYFQNSSYFLIPDYFFTTYAFYNTFRYKVVRKRLKQTDRLKRMRCSNENIQLSN